MAWTKEQEEAIYKSGTNIIVSAGAGSGKTAVLTERVIKKIENGIHINELLILTFTKAAASEMKERIRASLKKNGYLDELKLIDSAYITTFDSYALSIVKKYHYLLNISKNINIVEATLVNMEKNRIMDEVFECFYEKEDELFLKLINDFCVRDDKNLKNYFIGIANKLEMLPDINMYLNTYMDKYYDSEYITNRVLEYEKLVFDKIEELKHLIDNLAILADGTYIEKLNESISGILNSTSIEELINYRSVKLPTLPRGSEDEVKQLKEEVASTIKNIISMLEYGTKEEIEESLYRTKDYTKVIIDIIKEYISRITDYKKVNEMYEFNDIALLAIKVLRENTDICDEVKYSLKEILVDEYQDTNDLQETFIGLIANNNVYMVGDIKQSIYRFRNANPYIFKTKYDNYSKLDGGIKIDLVKNFRSRDIVLYNINDIFDLVMDNIIGGAEYSESHRMVFGNTAYIEEGKTSQDYDLEVLEYEIEKDSIYTKEEIEIFAVAKDIKEKVDNKYQVFDKGSKVLKDASYNDFVILMDRTSSFDMYKKIFEYVGIPLTLYKDETLNNSDDIAILKNVINLIIKINTKVFDTEFKYAYTSVARSFLFNMKDSDIFECFTNNSFKDTLIYKLFDDIDINVITPYQLLDIIINKTNYYNKLITIGDIESGLVRIQKLYEMASNLSSYGYDILKFSEYFNTLVEDGYEIKYSMSSDGADSVKIMTIHKSKGLEYHICYFTGLYKTFNISDIKDSFIYSNKYGIITPYFLEGINTTIYKELLKNNYMNEEISEKIRLFYVALTRAKEKMIMLLPKKETEKLGREANGVIDNSVRNKYKSFADIMYSVRGHLEKYYKDLDVTNINLTKDYLYIKDRELNLDDSNQRIVVNELNIEKEEIESLSFSKKTNDLISMDSYNNMHFGTKVHEILEHIDFNNKKDIDNKFIDDKINKLLSHNLFKNVSSAKTYKEYEFIYIEDNIEYHGIIDLMLEYEDHIDIIDYKLKNVDSDAYINQLKGYQKYISTKTDNPVNLYLFSIIDGEIKEIN